MNNNNNNYYYKYLKYKNKYFIKGGSTQTIIPQSSNITAVLDPDVKDELLQIHIISHSVPSDSKIKLEDLSYYRIHELLFMRMYFKYILNKLKPHYSSLLVSRYSDQTTRSDIITYYTDDVLKSVLLIYKISTSPQYKNMPPQDIVNYIKTNQLDFFYKLKDFIEFLNILNIIRKIQDTNPKHDSNADFNQYLSQLIIN